ncbi:MAG: signal peptidase I [Pyrinomonadaceae bacterium]
MSLTRPILIVIMVIACLPGCMPGESDVVPFQGTSMLPGIRDSEKLHIIRFDRGAKFEVKRGDIIMFLYPEDTTKFYIKRLIGLPGESVEIRAGKVVIDGRELDEPYVDPKLNQAGESRQAVTIQEHNYYVLGDNRDSSSDSRSWGSVPEKDILAKVVNK